MSITPLGNPVVPDVYCMLQTSCLSIVLLIFSTSATLTFSNESGWIAKKINKTVSEWENVASLDDLLPSVPYKLGYTNGRWDYNAADVLSSLRAGNDVTVTPVYDSLQHTEPTPQVPDGDEPVLDLYYEFDSANSVGSFTMAAGIPDGCDVKSIGIAFFYKKAEDFDPTGFNLSINNRTLTSKFDVTDESGLFTVDVKNLNSKYNWAAKGYITYYQDDLLRVAYSNQINIVNRAEVINNQAAPETPINEGEGE